MFPCEHIRNIPDMFLHQFYEIFMLGTFEDTWRRLIESDASFREYISLPPGVSTVNLTSLRLRLSDINPDNLWPELDREFNITYIRVQVK